MRQNYRVRTQNTSNTVFFMTLISLMFCLLRDLYRNFYFECLLVCIRLSTVLVFLSDAVAPLYFFFK
jgi:hypothetical protein